MKTWHRILASVTLTKTFVGNVTVVSRQPYMLGAQFADGTSAPVMPVVADTTNSTDTMTKQLVLSFLTILMTFHNSTVWHI